MMKQGRSGRRRKLVVIGMLGSTLDNGTKKSTRWDRWRPTISICQHEDLVVDRFDLLHSGNHQRLAEVIASEIATVSPETATALHQVELQDPWDFEEVYGALYDFTHAYPWKPDDEDYLIHITTGTHVVQICLFLLAESRHMPARLLQTSPPRRQRGDDVGEYAIIDLDLSRYDLIAARFAKTTRDDLAFLKSGIETRNAAFNRLIEEIEKVAARSPEPILLNGPTGAGKSRLGRRIYDLRKSRRQIAGRFVEVNCATLRGDQAMAALFGHVRGAFTGANESREGLLRATDGGILFLDEIGELGLDEQAMLLRAIEEKRFLPLGSDDEVSSDFQLIAGTNRDLAERVAAGQFRRDLLARIDLWTFNLPGLCHRREDICPNLDYELDNLSNRLGRRMTMNREAREHFLSFAESPQAAWTGNFRDLAAAVTRMATLAEGGRISLADTKDEIKRLQMQWRREEEAGDPDRRNGAGSDEEVLRLFLSRESIDEIDLFDRAQLGVVLRQCMTSPSLSEAGRRLFSASRQRRKSANDADRLRKYLARFELSWKDIRDVLE